MSEAGWAAVDAYIEGLLVDRSAALAATLEASAAAGLPPHNVGANQGKLIMLLARAQRLRVLERRLGARSLGRACGHPEGSVPSWVTKEVDDLDDRYRRATREVERPILGLDDRPWWWRAPNFLVGELRDDLQEELGR